MCEECKPAPLNVENIRTVFQIATIHPEVLNQKTWVNGFAGKIKETDVLIPMNCGTTGCMAGWISILKAPKGTQFFTNNMKFPSGGYHEYESFAAEKFGFEYYEATRVFFNTNHLGDVQRVLIEIFEDREMEIPDWLNVELPPEAFEHNCDTDIDDCAVCG